jgi:hypothetical protein
VEIPDDGMTAGGAEAEVTRTVDTVGWMKEYDEQRV